MASIAASLSQALPKPKYTGEDEEIPAHAQQRGPRVVGAGQIDESQIVLRRTGPPPYGQRAGWRPRTQEDFGDGGAFPEIPVAQYPLEMGKKGNTSNALAIQVDSEGKVKYDAIAKQGHAEGRIVQSSFKDLIPLRQRADAGEIDLSRPDAEKVAETTEKTKNALAALVSGAVSAQKPKNVNISERKTTFVRYQPASQMGDNSQKQDRIMKIVERQRDPMEPLVISSPSLRPSQLSQHCIFHEDGIADSRLLDRNLSTRRSHGALPALRRRYSGHHHES